MSLTCCGPAGTNSNVFIMGRFLSSSVDRLVLELDGGGHALSEQRFLHWPYSRFVAGWIQWKRKVKAGSGAFVPGHPESPGMAFDNGTADRKTHTHSPRFRGVKCLKDILDAFWMDPDAGVTYSHDY